MHGIVSIKQIDILRSIKFPLVKADYADELDWDASRINPRTSHPATSSISELLKTKKDYYILRRLAGDGVVDACAKAEKYVSNKKTDT